MARVITTMRKIFNKEAFSKQLVLIQAIVREV
jgi:hypothetical protein